MPESSLYFKQRLKGADVDLDADLIGVAHPKGGTTDELAMSLRELSKALGGNAAAPLIIQGAPTTPAIRFLNPAGGDVAQLRIVDEGGNGYASIGLGPNALAAFGVGAYSVAIGTNCLSLLTIGNWNAAVGHDAMAAATNNNLNAAFGCGALAKNKIGTENVAVGADAMANADSPYLVANTAVGRGALSWVQGNGNVGTGYRVLPNLKPGAGNAFFGVNGGDKLVNGNSNVGLGNGAGPSGDFTGSISLGDAAIAPANYTAVVGADNITDVYFGSVTGASKMHGKGDAIVFPSADPHILGAGYWAGAVWTRSAG